MITIAQSCSPKVYNRWGLPSKPKTPTVSPSPPASLLLAAAGLYLCLSPQRPAPGALRLRRPRRRRAGSAQAPSVAATRAHV
jgi:hypothetical protein